MKSELGRALRRELKSVRVDRDLKDRILRDERLSVHRPARRRRRGWPLAAAVAALAVLLVSAVLLLHTRAAHPDLIAPPVLAPGGGLATMLPKASIPAPEEAAFPRQTDEPLITPEPTPSATFTPQPVPDEELEEAADAESTVELTPGQVVYSDDSVYYHADRACPQYDASVSGGFGEWAEIDQGREPCPVCVVWSTTRGKYYHRYDGRSCSGMHNALPISRSVALAWGRYACPLCLAEDESLYGVTSVTLEASVFGGDVLVIECDTNSGSAVDTRATGGDPAISMPAGSLDEAALLLRQQGVSEGGIEKWRALRMDQPEAVIRANTVEMRTDDPPLSRAWRFRSVSHPSYEILLYPLDEPWRGAQLYVELTGSTMEWQYDGVNLTGSVVGPGFRLSYFDEYNYGVTAYYTGDSAEAQGEEEPLSLPLSYGGTARRYAAGLTVGSVDVRVTGCLLNEENLALIVSADEPCALSAELTLPESALDSEVCLREANGQGWLIRDSATIAEDDALVITANDETRMLTFAELEAMWLGEQAEAGFAEEASSPNEYEQD